MGSHCAELTAIGDLDKRAIGEMNTENVREMFRALSLFPLTARTRMSNADFERLMQAVAVELEDQDSRPYLTLWVLSAWNHSWTC